MTEETKGSIVQRQVLLRANASQAEGYGHVMRCLTLGNELRKRGYHVSLLSRTMVPFLAERAAQFGIELEVNSELDGGLGDANYVHSLAPNLIVVDGYDFSVDFFKTLKLLGQKFVVFDDNGDRPIEGSLLVINQNLHANRAMYPDVPPGQLLLGPSYALIRPEILALNGSRDGGIKSLSKSVLVAVGGTDVVGINSRIAEAISRELGCDVVCPTPVPGSGVRLCPLDIARSLAQASVAIIGAGSTIFEALYLGVPSVAVVVADNQEPLAAWAHDRELLIRIDARREVDIDGIVQVTKVLLNFGSTQMHLRSDREKVVDGRGIYRLADALESATES